MVTYLPHHFAIWDPYSRAPRVELYQSEFDASRHGREFHNGATRIYPWRPFQSEHTLDVLIEEIHWNLNPQYYRTEIRIGSERRPLFVCDTSLFVSIAPPPNHHWRDVRQDPIPLLLVWHPPLTMDPTIPEILYIQGFGRWEQELLRMWDRLLRTFHLPVRPHPFDYEGLQEFERLMRQRRRNRNRARRREESESDSDSDSDEETAPAPVPRLLTPPAPAAPAPTPAATPPPAAAPRAPAERIALAIARDFISTKELCPITQSPLTEGRIAVAACNCVFQAEGLETWAAAKTTCPSCRTTLTYRVVTV